LALLIGRKRQLLEFLRGVLGLCIQWYRGERRAQAASQRGNHANAVFPHVNMDALYPNPVGFSPRQAALHATSCWTWETRAKRQAACTHLNLSVRPKADSSVWALVLALMSRGPEELAECIADLLRQGSKRSYPSRATGSMRRRSVRPRRRFPPASAYGQLVFSEPDLLRVLDRRNRPDRS
jgi:hypothetical protein